MSKAQIPVIVGQSQFTQRNDTQIPLDPLGLMKKTCAAAFADSGGKNPAQVCDTLYVVNIMSWTYADACSLLSRELGIEPKHKWYSVVGGGTPQALVNKAANDIASGKSKAVLITGAECVSSLRRKRKKELILDWPKRTDPLHMDGEDRVPMTELEMLHDFFTPATAFPFFENALRHALGRDLKTHIQAMGRICEHLSGIAAKNPYAWIREPGTADEITTPLGKNRMVVYPYTLRMNANIHVDMSAALFMTSQEQAEKMGVDPSRMVYPLGGAALNNIWTVTRRPTLHDSPALRKAAGLALAQAQMVLDDIGVFDFYSCFPWSVEVVMHELGIGLDDPRDLSVTGGLPYFGGPGNNYSTHAIATIVERIRQDRNLKAMVTGLGWFNTKYSVGIYGGDPPEKNWSARDDSKIQASIDAKALPGPANEKPSGPIKIDAYIICHDRNGEPEHGTVVGTLKNGQRTCAYIDADPHGLAALEKIELVGCTGASRHENGRNLVKF